MKNTRKSQVARVVNYSFSKKKKNILKKSRIDIMSHEESKILHTVHHCGAWRMAPYSQVKESKAFASSSHDSTALAGVQVDPAWTQCTSWFRVLLYYYEGRYCSKWKFLSQNL